MIVVDTNVIVHFWLKAEFDSNAKRLFFKDPVWAAPLLWRSEFRNVLSLYLRKKIFSLNKILSLIENVEKQFINSEFYVPSLEIMELVYSSNCSAYDCEFVALAKQLNTKLITTDKQILKEFPSITLPLVNF